MFAADRLEIIDLGLFAFAHDQRPVIGPLATRSACQACFGTFKAVLLARILLFTKVKFEPAARAQVRQRQSCLSLAIRQSGEVNGLACRGNIS